MNVAPCAPQYGFSMCNVCGWLDQPREPDGPKQPVACVNSVFELLPLPARRALAHVHPVNKDQRHLVFLLRASRRTSRFHSPTAEDLEDVTAWLAQRAAEHDRPRLLLLLNDLTRHDLV